MKALRTMIGMAAVTMAVIACNVIEETTVLPQERLVEFTATILPPAATRSTLNDNGDGSAAACWEVGDKIYLEYEQVGSGGARTGKAPATVKTVNPSTGAATITATLINPKNNGAAFIGYPFTPYNEGTADKIDLIQEGTLADIIRNHVRMEASGELHINGNSASLMWYSDMENKGCIWKLVIKNGGSNITSNVKKLNILINSYGYNTVYSVETSGKSAIYVALPHLQDVGITISADTNSASYTMEEKPYITLVAGQMYTSTVTLDTRNYPVNLADAIPADVGRPIGSDGKIYRNWNHAHQSLVNEPVAMVAFVKTNEEYTNCDHGLAISLTEPAPIPLSWSDITNSGQHLYEMNNNSANMYYISGYNTWRIPSLTDWQLMFKSCGGNDGTSTFTLFDETNLLVGGLFFSCGDLGTMIKAHGHSVKDFENEAYWAQTTRMGNVVKAYYNFTDNKFYEEATGNAQHLFRPCFPF